MKFASADEILDFAIVKEEEAAQFYINLAGKMAPPNMKEVFEEFAQEEKKHKEKLLLVKSGQKLLLAGKKVPDLKIGDTLLAVDTTVDVSDITYQEALIIAMKAEKAAFKLYHDLAQNTKDAELKNLFLSLAQEEAKHKLRFEIEYDDNILIEG
jgi:rubrerythrin